MPHVYDFADGPDADEKNSPITQDMYNRRRFLTCYGKEQKTSFGTILIDRNGVPDASSGSLGSGDGMVMIGAGGLATYRFQIDLPVVYDVTVRVGFPFWDKNGLRVSLDGTIKTLSENQLWWPYWRKICWMPLATRINLSAGQHTIVVSEGVVGAQFYGFRICDAFFEKCLAGSAAFTLSPRSFKDVNGNMAVPDKGFKLTTEALRRKPDSALIWYEDFRDQNTLQETYWQTLSGSWNVWRDDSSPADRPYSQLEGSGRLAWKYDQFRDVHIRARLAFSSNGSNRAGVFCGDVFCCVNIENQRVELYQGNTLLGGWQGEYARTPDASIRKNPNMHLIEMRRRGNKVRVYSGASSVLRFSATISSSAGYAGVQSDGPIKCELLRLGDAWIYEPYEAFDVAMPGGITVSYGRIPRSGVTWDDAFGVFTVQSDVEEIETRSENISMDFDFYHSSLLPLGCGNDYTITVTPRDINVWIARLYLGDADGFSILYYQDVDSLVYWANEAAYRWKLRGFALWSLGQEDLRLWEALPRATSATG